MIIFDTIFPAPKSLLRSPCSEVPTPYSLFPIPCSLCYWIKCHFL
ncbi:hypothetical protein [Moorena sp. SIOASIH]|nr:hypothetical protein [Moorena sp. SIOASIH]